MYADVLLRCTKSEASHSVKPGLVNMLNVKILYVWLEEFASHSLQVIRASYPWESPDTLSKLQWSSQVLSVKTRAWYTVTHLPCTFFEGIFFLNHSREECVSLCPLQGYIEEIGRVIPAIKVIFPLCPFQLTPCSPHSLSSYLVSFTHQNRKIPSK